MSDHETSGPAAKATNYGMATYGRAFAGVYPMLLGKIPFLVSVAEGEFVRKYFDPDTEAECPTPKGGGVLDALERFRAQQND